MASPAEMVRVASALAVYLEATKAEEVARTAVWDAVDAAVGHIGGGVAVSCAGYVIHCGVQRGHVWHETIALHVWDEAIPQEVR